MTEPNGGPRPTADLDADLHHLIHRSRWVQGVALALLSILVAAGFFIVGKQLVAQNRELTAACSFYQDITGISVKPIPPLKRPSRLTVLLVTHARSAYIGLGCSPDISSPDPSLVFWARYYRIPVP
jgi:hypothetical protein